MLPILQRILTTEWIDGYKISDMDNIRKDKFDLADIDRKLFQIFSEQIFNTGFVHADPHPGNGTYVIIPFLIFLRLTNLSKCFKTSRKISICM